MTETETTSDPSGEPRSESRARAAQRFALFTACVLGGPALAFVVLAPESASAAGPAMLAFILTPALAGGALVRGVGEPAPVVAPKLVRALLVSALASLVVVAISIGAALLLGALALGPGPLAENGALPAIGSAVVTSTLEELGWAHGGIVLARAALGRRGGVLALGIVWAAWHLVVAAFAPADVSGALFVRGDPLAAGPLAGFVLGCVVYRALLTELRDHAGSLWPAALSHALVNVVLGGLFGAGALRLVPGGPWAAFPAPTGLVFALACGAALAWLRSRRSPRAARPG